MATCARQHFQYTSREFLATLDGLIRIGGGPYRDAFVGCDFAQLLLQQPRRMFLYVDLAFEIRWVFLHVLVGISRVAVFAGEFATAVRIYAPGKGERHLRD